MAQIPSSGAVSMITEKQRKARFTKETVLVFCHHSAHHILQILPPELDIKYSTAFTMPKLVLVTILENLPALRCSTKDIASCLQLKVDILQEDILSEPERKEYADKPNMKSNIARFSLSAGVIAKRAVGGYKKVYILSSPNSGTIMGTREQQTAGLVKK